MASCGISMKEKEKIRNDRNDPFAGLDDIKEETFKTLTVDLAVLRNQELKKQEKLFKLLRI